MPHSKRPAFRISIRLLLALIFAASVPLSFVAVHFHRLGRQTEAREFLLENHCLTFPGAIEEMKAARVRSVSSFYKPDCWLFVQTINPTTSATQQSGMLTAIFGPDFYHKDSVVWIGIDASFNEFKFAKLLSELQRMHWLGAIVIETLPADLGICDLDFNEIRTEQCPLTHEQFEELENTFPEIRIQKSCFEYAPPQPRD